MGFVGDIFTDAARGEGFEAPLTAYQEYCVRRFREDRNIDTRTDLGRFAALMWFLGFYGPLRKPMRIPLGGDQIRWLLESSAPYMAHRALPRVVEYFWRKSMADIANPYADPDDYDRIAYWWAAEMAPHMAVEHALLPDDFIAALAASSFDSPRALPVSVFLREFMRLRPDMPWSAETQTERLACYLRVLSEPLGDYYSLFFPRDVLARLDAFDIGDARLEAFAGFDGAAMAAGVRRKVESAARYRANHRRWRSGAEDLIASTTGETWAALLAKPAPASAKRDPRPNRPETSVLPFPVRVIGPINSQSGLGQATRMSIDALHTVGVRPVLYDFYLDNPAPRRLTWPDDALAPAPFAINILHLNAESIPLAAAYLDPALFSGAYNLGYFFWELPQAARCHDLAIAQLDEIWVSSEFNRQTYAALTDRPVEKPGMAVETLPDIGDVDRAAIRARHGVPATATAFLVTFDGFSFIKRKNPAAVLRAFIQAFPGGEDVALVLKTHNLSEVLGEANVQSLLYEIRALARSDPRIVLIDETLSFHDLLALKAACDAYVSLHRSEGWGFGAVEAMQLERPVIATGFSGNLEFCTPETSFLIPQSPVYLERDDYIFVRPGDYWAEPDIAAAAAAMRSIHQDPGAARAVGQRARRFVEAQFSLQAVGARYLERLRQIAAAQTSTPGV